MHEEPRRRPGAHKPHPSQNMSKIETYLDKYFGEGSSIQLPVPSRRILVRVAPLLSMVAAVLIALFIRTYWQMGMERYENASQLVENASRFSQLGTVWHLILVFLGAQIILLLASLPAIFRRKRSGWNGLLRAALLNLVTGVLYLFIPGFGFPNVIGTVVISAGALLGLMQTRSYFR